MEDRKRPSVAARRGEIDMTGLRVFTPAIGLCFGVIGSRRIWSAVSVHLGDRCCLQSAQKGHFGHQGPSVARSRQSGNEVFKTDGDDRIIDPCEVTDKTRAPGRWVNPGKL